MYHQIRVELQWKWLRWSYLKATKTVSAFCAFVPNTLSKNRDATVVPDFRMSAFDDALYIYDDWETSLVE
jgi:hypothetical protein